jgi:hypothetical protein
LQDIISASFVHLNGADNNSSDEDVFLCNGSKGNSRIDSVCARVCCGLHGVTTYNIRIRLHMTTKEGGEDFEILKPAPPYATDLNPNHKPK